jgi:hypothetical protein
MSSIVDDFAHIALRLNEIEAKLKQDSTISMKQDSTISISYSEDDNGWVPILQVFHATPTST